MVKALVLFHESIRRARDLHGLHASLTKQVTGVLDLSDLLRAQLVLGVSALDHFVHELTRQNMIECWLGMRPKSKGFEKFMVPISAVSAISGGATSSHIIDAEIRNRHSYQSFQMPDKIADAVRLFSDIELWKLVAKELKEDTKSVKESLSVIVERRNKIAHEADIDPSFPGQRWPIDPGMVASAIDRLEAIGNAIGKVSV